MTNHFTTPLRLAQLAVLMAVSGCASQSAQAPVAFPPKPHVFNQWTVKECRIEQEREDIFLLTDGRISDDTIRFELVAPYTFPIDPIISFYGVGGLNIPQYGLGNTRAFEFPYTPEVAANMLQNRVFIHLEVLDPRFGKTKQVVFTTRSFPQAMAYLGETCPITRHDWPAWK